MGSLRGGPVSRVPSLLFCVCNRRFYEKGEIRVIPLQNTFDLCKLVIFLTYLL